MFKMVHRPAKEHALVLLNQAPPLPQKTLQKAFEQCYANLTSVVDPATQGVVQAYINQSWNMLCCLKSNWALQNGNGQAAVAWSQMSPGRLKSLTEAALQVPSVLHELSNWFPFHSIDGERALVVGTPLQRQALNDLVIQHRNDFMQLVSFLGIERQDISTDGNLQEEGKLMWKYQGLPTELGDSLAYPEEAQRLFFVREALRRIGQNAPWGQQHPFNRHQPFAEYTIGATNYVGFAAAQDTVEFDEVELSFYQSLVVLDNPENWYDSINPDTYKFKLKTDPDVASKATLIPAAKAEDKIPEKKEAV